MEAPPSIIDLFDRLALHIRSSSANKKLEDVNEIHLLVLKLNQYLNLDGNSHSRTRVLDAALSLSCFSALQVFEAQIEFLVKSIASIVSSSIICEVLCFENEQSLRIGSSIMRQNCVRLLEMCDNIIPKLEGRFSYMLLRAVARLAVSMSCCQYMNSLQPIFAVTSVEGNSAAVSRLYAHLPKELAVEKEQMPPRLMFWYLDPLILKQVISDVLQDVVQRPFLCLADELHQRMDWRAIVICLVLSPVMFIKIRALLHRGLASVLDLLVALVSAVIDAMSRPMWWGLPMELSSKLPFSVAYFPHRRKLLRILAGGFSVESFLHLVHCTCSPFQCAREAVQDIEETSLEAAADHKSLWALAIDFPDWFFFALSMLFSGISLQASFHSKLRTAGTPEVEQLCIKDLPSTPSTSAARYIAWILSPFSGTYQLLLVQYLIEISEFWKNKQFDPGTSHKATSCKKKFKKLKILDDKGSHSDVREYDSQLIETWLKETQNLFMRYTEKSVNGSTSSAANMFYRDNPHRTVLLRKIPLGILIAHFDHITEDGFELLLHYAATGRMFQHKGFEREYVKLNVRSGRITTSTDECGKKVALAGICLVFSLTDTIENISCSFLENEGRAKDFIHQFKIKSHKYLTKCINRLIGLNLEKDGYLMVSDLHSRLVRWKHQGKELLGPKNLDEVMNVLSCTLSSLKNL